MLMNWISISTDFSGMLGMGRGGANTSLGFTVPGVAGILGLTVDMVDLALEETMEWYRDRGRYSRAELRAIEREYREDMQEELGPVLSAHRLLTALSVFIAISILALLAFLFLSLIEQKWAALVGMAGSAIAALTALIALIAIAYIRSEIRAIRELRGVLTVSATFWVWAALILSMASVVLIGKEIFDDWYSR